MGNFREVLFARTKIPVAELSGIEGKGLSNHCRYTLTDFNLLMRSLLAPFRNRLEVRFEVGQVQRKNRFNLCL